MALKKCTECGHDVSTQAVACPQCGAKIKKPTSLITKILATIFALGIAAAVLIPKAETSAADSASSAKKAADPKREAAFQKTLTVVRSIKASLRDPSSVEWSTITANEDASVVCVSYRARNGFGGKVIEGVTYAKGKLTTSSAAWNKNCANKTLANDFRHIRSVM